MDPRSDCSQEQFDLDLHCLPKRIQNIFANEESRRLVMIGALRVNNESSVSRVKIFMKYAHMLIEQRSTIISLRNSA